MYNDSKRTCTAIVLLFKPFVWWPSRRRRRRRRGLPKLPNNNSEDARFFLGFIGTITHS